MIVIVLKKQTTSAVTKKQHIHPHCSTIVIIGVNLVIAYFLFVPFCHPINIIIMENFIKLDSTVILVCYMTYQVHPLMCGTPKLSKTAKIGVNLATLLDF